MNEVGNHSSSSEFIDISAIFGILKKRKKVVLITTLIFTFLSFFISFFVISPKYSSSTDILVNRKETGNQINAQAQIQADVQMINTYKDIITSPTILNSVSSRLEKQGYSISPDKIKNSISITSQQNSQVFAVNVKTKNPGLSAAIANMTARVFKEKVTKIMSVNNVSILSAAQVNSKPVSPKVMVDTIIGLLAGIVLGVVLAFIANSFDRTINDMSFITNELKLNDLGIVSEIPANKVKKMITTARTTLTRSSKKGNRRI